MHPRNRFWLDSCVAAVALIVLLAVGCSDEEPETANVSVRETTVDQLDAAVAQQKGKVILVDVWGVT